MRRLLPVILFLSFCTSLSAQKAILEDFKPVCDSITVLAKQRFRVRSYIKLNKAMKRDGKLDLYFTKELSDYPWRDADLRWFKARLKELWPEPSYGLGSIFCESVAFEDLSVPAIGNDGAPKEYTHSIKAPSRTHFIEQIGGHKADRGLDGRYIALWQSHGRYFDNGAGEWSWQRSPNWRTTEDLYTQSYVLPFLIPMLERAGAYVMTPRERDLNTREIIIDNNSHFRSPGYPVRTHGSYKEKGQWSDAGTGFADKKEVYVKDDNPFTMGSARKASSVQGKATASARWNPGLEENGCYAVYISYKTLPESSRNAHYTVVHRGGTSEFIVNQKRGGGTWIYLGTFELGPDSYVMLDNGTPAGRSFERGVVSADAVKIGGGIGKIARGRGKDASSWEISDVPSYLEGAMYWEQWAGMPYERINQWEKDYTMDFASRGEWVKMLKDDLDIPFDMSLAFHTDAGVTPDDSIVGTLSIYTLMADGSRKFHKGGADRMSCRVLADFVQSQIVNDLRTDYDSLWTRRQLWNRSYSESRTTDVPGMLLELLAHQNFADMKFGLDPGFRFDVSRAVYKGMLKFLSTYYGERYVVAPLPVNSFSAVFGSEGKVLLSWEPTNDDKEPTAKPTGYIVYCRKDDGAFDNGRKVGGCSVELPIEEGHIYSYKIEAFNRGGRSFPSEVLSIGKAGSEARKVLVVNNFDRVSAPSWFDSPQYAGFDSSRDGGIAYIKDISYAGESYEYRRDRAFINNSAPGTGACDTDMAGFQAAGNNFDYPSVHGSQLLSLGYSFCSASRDAFCKAPANPEYFAIDLICGKQVSTLVGNPRGPVRYKVFPKELQEALKESAAAGCNLLVSGAYIATDAWDEFYPIGDDSYQQEARSFIEKTLGYRWVSSRGSVNGKVKFDDRSIRYCSSLSEDSYCVEMAGAIRPTSGGRTIATYTNRKGAAVYHPFDAYKVVAISFPIEITEGSEDMKYIFKQSMQLFE